MKLMEEAAMPNGDARSKKIYESLDDWLKMMVKAVVRPKRKINEENSNNRKVNFEEYH